MSNANNSIPLKYQILPELMPINIPGFENASQGFVSLAPEGIREQDWFKEFCERLTEHSGSFLPVCRLSDGEFKFLFGRQIPSVRWPLWKRCFLAIREILSYLKSTGVFNANTLPGVSSGCYTRSEWTRARKLYGKYLREISECGILAIHLSFCRVPFQEHYIPAFKRWMESTGITLSRKNYFPFYFVYGLFCGPEGRKFISGKKILLVHSAQGVKQERITRSLLSQGADQVHWLSISPAQSFFDRVSLHEVQGKADIAFVGAGVGKPSILMQLKPLGIPCIDVGYLFEIWADPQKAHERSFCLPDDGYQSLHG